MKLQFKHQKFQADAARAVCDVFTGQPFATHSYMIDPGKAANGQAELFREDGFANEKLTNYLTPEVMLSRIQKMQRDQQIKPSDTLVGPGINLTIEMETGVGKTYTYIKTIYELNKLYGWCKFIIVVPSIAIREGVYKSFQITQDHFNDEYGKKIRFFIYNSAKLSDISHFAQDSSINCMIINSQAFNAKGADARRIYMELDEFRSRKPIDVIAKTNPILIIDEPQSVEGKQTKERLKEFHPLMTLRYSATHKADSIYNMVYRLDAVEAYNQQLVKKIAVKAIHTTGTTGTSGYLYLQNLILSPTKPPMAVLEFEVKGKEKVRKEVHRLEEGANIYELSQYDKNSEGIDAYKDRYIIKSIDGRDNSVEFLNGIKLYAGDVSGANEAEEQVRRLQIRETIITHLERERQLFHKGIKVLSLFFIDEVAKYKVYENSVAMNGVYADIFEEEYNAIVQNYLNEFAFDEAFQSYLRNISADATHAGYFSIDKKSKQMIDGKIDKKENRSDDTDAYDLIMKNKERLLDRNEPVRFIFSHSALREGWDNPNIFQICTLKQSSADVRKRQEVGRGLRLCVNQFGERQDAAVLGGDVQKVNVLTVIANESYDSFAKALQTEYAEAVADRPKQITEALFINKIVHNARGEEATLTADDASEIIFSMAANQYIDIRKKTLTDKFYDDKAAGKLLLPESMESFRDDIVKIINSIYDPVKLAPEDASKNNVTLHLDDNKLKRKEFQELWKQINTKTAYIVDFDTDELISKAIQQINTELRVSRIFAVIESGAMESIQSKDALLDGKAFSKAKRDTEDDLNAAASSKVKYDLIGKIVAETGLTRDAVAKILKGINADKFAMFKLNPEEFIIKTSTLINEQKATVIVQQITYNKLTETHNTDIFTEPNMKGQLGVNAMVSPKHLYDYLIFDSKASEQKFAEELEAASEVILYVKLPRGFYINTPVGKYNPDWAIAFDSEKVKHVYFVAETKGDLSTLQLREIESAKIQCARKHFAAISTDSVVYDHVSCYEDLLKVVK